MTQFQPRDLSYADRVADAFRNESAAARWQAKLTAVSPGVAEITLPCREDLSAAAGATHRSIVAALLDDACALAALSLTSAGDVVTTAEYKLNFLAPASRSEVIARAEVIRPRPQYHRLSCRRLRPRATDRPDACHDFRVPPMNQIW